MPSLRVYTAAEQVANHLREELARGVWTGTMPGGAALARELGVGRMTVDAALELLEKGGYLMAQGPGRRRLIKPSAANSSSLKLAVLPFLIEDYRRDYVMEFRRLLEDEGHRLLFSGKSITDLGGNVARIAQLVESTHADAWLIIAGPRDVLSWFIESKIPAFAMFGRRRGLPIASVGPDKERAYRTIVRHLVQLGHERITLITRPLRRIPEPGLIERAFLNELELSGIRTGAYNLPDWDGKADTMRDLLDSMFRVTPPTAVLVDEPSLYYSVQHHLARRGILAPEHVSMVCTDWDPYFEMQRPSIAHIQWDSRPWVRRAMRWVRNVSKDKVDLRQSLTKTEYVSGGTVGPAAKA